MLKTLTLAGVVLAASTSIAFADTTDSMSNGSADNTSTVSTTTEADGAQTATTTTTVKHKHHKKHHNKRHHHRHYRTQEMAAPAAESAPAGGYKGEVAQATCPACVHNTFNSGAYVGFGVGSLVNYVSRPAVSTAIQGTLFGGYGMLWDQVYGALEIFGQDAASINNYRSRAGSVQSTWGYGLSVLPGYLITDDVLGYLRLGVVNTHFTSGSSNQTGGQVGLGMQTALTPCWDLRGEWIYSFYNSMRVGVPKSQQFNLGLLYKFQV